MVRGQTHALLTHHGGASMFRLGLTLALFLAMVVVWCAILDA